ncbi:5'/3'-nucleotidase SurE [candidate division KSB1 bacterium]
MKKPLILITNDDGIYAPGLRHLINLMKDIGQVVVVAPERSQSGMGHAITVKTPLRLRKIIEEVGYIEYSCNGTPVDAVKMANKIILKRKPDILVSGINHGSNASINVIYSGTMAAVLEAAIENIPSVGFSLRDFSYDADFSATGKYIKNIVQNILMNGLPKDTCLNVNFPAVNGSEIKGVKVCRQARAFWNEKFDMRSDPHKREYYWLTGEFNRLEDDKDTDEWALDNNYISVVPIEFDFTAHHAISEINNWNFNA